MISITISIISLISNTYLQKPSLWKNQLTVAINFVSSKSNDEEQVMPLKSNNIELMTYDNVNEVIKEIFESFRSRY